MDCVLSNGFIVTNLTNENKKILELLVKSSKHADEFIFNFLMDASNENFAVSEFRHSRILKQKLSIEKFLLTYTSNKIDALEGLFCHPITEHEFSLLTNKINNGKITIEGLYRQHLEYPRAKMIRLLL